MPVAMGCTRMLMLPLVNPGKYRDTDTCMMAEVVVAPRLSEAVAVSVCAPRARLAEKLNGIVVSLVNDARPSKNWTFVTLPSESLAVAWMLTVAGPPKVRNEALSAGLVMVTEGAALNTLTLTLTTLEVADKPRLSVATAVKLCAPTARVVRRL